MLKKIQNIIELLVFIGLVYFLFPSGGNPILWLIKFMFYIIFVFFLTYMTSKQLTLFRGYIEKNIWRWLVSGYNTEHNLKKASLINRVLQPLYIYIGNLILDRKRIWYYTINFVRQEWMITLFFIVPFIILFGYTFYLIFRIFL